MRRAQNRFLLYASGNLGKSLQWGTVDLVYLYFLTDIIGLAPVLAATIIGISIIWDAVLDPIVGRLIDRLRIKGASYRMLLALSIPVSAFGFVGLFLFPLAAMSDAPYPVLLASLFFRVGYTFVDIPHNALIGSLSTQQDNRSRMAVYRFAFSAAGTIVMALLAAPLFQSLADGGQHDVLTFALLGSAVYIIIMYISVAGSREPTASVPLPVAADIRTIIRAVMSAPFVRILTIGLAASMLIPILPKFTAYFAMATFGHAEATTWLIVTYAVGQALFLLGWLKLALATDKTTSFKIATIGIGVAALGFLVLSPSTMMAALIVFFLAGGASSGVYSMMWSILPDSVDEVLGEFGAQMHAVLFSVFLLVVKIGGALGTFTVGMVLEGAQYDAINDPSAGSDAIIWAITSSALAAACILYLTGSKQHKRLISGNAQ